MSVGVKHKDQTRFPCDLEPSLALHIDQLSKNHKIPRTKLLRMMVKFSLNHLPDVIKQGDRQWSPPSNNIS